MAMDALTSNATGNNILNFRKAGYSDSVSLAFFFFNLLSSQLIGYFTCCIVPQDPETFTWKCLVDRLASSDTSIPFMLAILVNLIVSEVCFTFSHGLLHIIPALLPLHVFHHCVTQPSASANLLFHPVDISLEFAGPVGSLVVMHFLTWKQDDLVLVASFMIVQLWYSWDHDELLNLYHAAHHIYCDSVYAIYTPFRGDTSKNLLRKQMIQQGFLKRDTDKEL